MLARRGAKKNFFAETGAARGDGQKSKHKTKKERIGIKTIKNIKKLKKTFIFPPFLAKRVGLFCVKKSKISEKNMPSEAWQNKKSILRKEDLLYAIRFEYEMA